MSRKICVCLDFLTEELRQRITKTAQKSGFSVEFFNRESDAETALPECEILFAHSVNLARKAPKTLKWYCCTWAGVESYCRDGGVFANADCLLTNSAGAYGVTIAEHILMVTLMLLRRMPEYQEIIRNGGWQNNLPIRSVQGSHITVLGAGDIGCTFADRARAFHPAGIVGISRSGRTRADVFDKTLPTARLDEALPGTDILVMALPNTPETAGILSRERLALLPRHAVVVNVGRGSAIDQAALADALNCGALAGAALDVMVPEPLPESHPLRSAKHILLTPHIAGNMTLGYTCEKAVSMFCEDLENYSSGLPLKHLVNRTRGY